MSPRLVAPHRRRALLAIAGRHRHRVEAGAARQALDRRRAVGERDRRRRAGRLGPGVRQPADAERHGAVPVGHDLQPADRTGIAHRPRARRGPPVVGAQHDPVDALLDRRREPLVVEAMVVVAAVVAAHDRSPTT